MDGKSSTQSVWQSESRPFLPAMAGHQACDVCVIGAGIAGLTTAYLLLKAGKTVAVLDRDGLTGGETALTSAHLASALDEGFTKLLRLHGTDKARLAFASHARAIDVIEEIVGREKIDCSFRRVPGYLFLGPESSIKDLQAEAAAARECGVTDVALLPRAPTNGFRTGPCLAYGNQGQFHPLRYTHGLVQAIQHLGGKIFSHTEAVSVEGGRPTRVATDRGFHVVSESVVVATNVPFNDRVTMHTKMAPYRTYCVGLPVPNEAVDNALFWDTADPYHYVRFTRDPVSQDSLMIVGGEDHRTGMEGERDRFAALESWARTRIDGAGSARYAWSGQVIEPHDGLAFIGRNPGEENVYIVTGDSGHGLTHGTIAGLLLSDLIQGLENPWEAVYDPSRVNLRSAKTFLHEAAQMASAYLDWVKSGDAESARDIPPGEGAVVREGAQKIAVYKDTFGRLHRYSAVCPHLNGLVRWNGVEKTWDCPCHGSRFDKMGSVLNGPASTGLKEIADTSILEGESASA